MKSLRPPLANVVFNFAGVSVANVGDEPVLKKQKSQGAEEGHNILVHKTENDPPATAHKNQALDSPDAISPALQRNESIPTASSSPAVNPAPASSAEEDESVEIAPPFRKQLDTHLGLHLPIPTHGHV